MNTGQFCELTILLHNVQNAHNANITKTISDFANQTLVEQLAARHSWQD